MDKLVSDWTGVPLIKIGSMDLIAYLSYRRDAFITKLNATESGREYLDKAWQLSRTEPDRELARRMFGSTKVEGGE